MTNYQKHQHLPRPIDRRGFLWEIGGGLGGVALAALLADEQLLAAETTGNAGPANAGNHLTPRPPHFAPRAKHVIQIFCPGAVSHVDTYDYKPELERRHGQPSDPTGKEQNFASKPGQFQKSYWPFRQHGQSGLWMSDLLPKLAACVDDMTFIYSMQSKTALHGPAMFMMNSGFIQPGFPAMGCWVTYGLGNETEELPAFVVLPDARGSGVPPGGPANWGAGFLPAVYQGTTLSSVAGRPPVVDLFPKQDPRITPAGERESREFLSRINQLHRDRHPGDSELEARIAAYELAARLQLSAPEATDLTKETVATTKLYGIDQPNKSIAAFGRQCLLARRLVERGVRFVQIWCGADNVPPPRPNWDAHEDIRVNHGKHGPVLDHGAAALIQDLKLRGMLDETLLMCTTEFGRQPGAQAGKGRDHNPGAFTVWMAGGGVQGGVGYGASDEVGKRAAEHPTYSYDLHATCLHLLGLDHERLSFYHNGIQRRLTDVHGHVIREIIQS